MWHTDQESDVSSRGSWLSQCFSLRELRKIGTIIVKLLLVCFLVTINNTWNWSRTPAYNPITSLLMDSTLYTFDISKPLFLIYNRPCELLVSTYICFIRLKLKNLPEISHYRNNTISTILKYITKEPFRSPDSNLVHDSNNT